MSAFDTTRCDLIAQLETTTTRQSRVITYLTRDQEPFGAKIALDVLPLFSRTLQRIGYTHKISLFLYSAGGDLDAPWPLVSLLREYCDELEVLVPFRALSAATLISLGANRIVMTPLSQLSPIDPEGIFVTEGKQEKYSVEDVQSYIEFAKEKVGIAESQPLSEVLKLLTQEIKPQVLGSLHRTHARIRRLARNMLHFHLSEPKCETQVTEIVNNLTQLLYSHNHLINRREAHDMVGFRDIVEYADADTELHMQQLFEAYVETLQLGCPFDPLPLLGEEAEVSITFHQAYIESRELCHVFETSLVMHKEAEQVKMQQTGVPSWHTYEREAAK
ncbi:MAG: hypothetical protein JXA14_12885 [Anaerolineae bacterium]|nr:hypothetical protein [Anaerolineae bacterium]